MPWRASIETVNAVPSGARFSRTIIGRPELVALLLGEREADEPAAVRGHEVDVLGRDALGGDAEVALVLAILVVHEDDHATGADFLQRLFDGDDRRSVTPVRHRDDDNRRPRWRPDPHSRRCLSLARPA